MTNNKYYNTIKPEDDVQCSAQGFMFCVKFWFSNETKAKSQTKIIQKNQQNVIWLVLIN